MRWTAVLLLAASTTTHAQMCMAPPTEAKVFAFASGTLVDNVGDCDLPIASKNATVQKLCKQGFAMMHCFWFDEAVRSFRDATKLDPTSGAAWLGLSASLTQPWNYSPEFRDEANFAIQKAVMNSEGEAPVVQALIAAYRAKEIGRDERGTPFETAMASLVKDYPQFDEPKLLYAGILCQRCMHTGYTPAGDLRGDLKRVMDLAAPVLKKNPHNAGAMHYHIHAMEPASPEKAVPSAEWIGKIASRSSHMVHMAGHIFNRVGRYEDADNAFKRATEIEEADAKTLNTTPQNANWNYGHNLSFRAMNLAEWGKIEEALVVEGRSSWNHVNLVWRSGDWPRVAELARKQYGSSSDNPNLLFFTGMEAWAQKDWIKARSLSDRLTAAVDKRLGSKDPAKYSTDDRMLASKRDELKGAVLAMDGKLAESRTAFEASVAQYHRVEYEEPVIYVRPPYHSYADALERAGEFSEAVKVLRRGLKDRPNSPWYLGPIARLERLLED